MSLTRFIAAMFMMISVCSIQAHAADIVFIGDSHSTGEFGVAVDSALRKLKGRTGDAAKVVSRASCGTKTSDWLRSKGPQTRCGTRSCDANGVCSKAQSGRLESLSALLEKESPEVVVVALGTNMLKSRLSDTISDAKAMIEKIKEAESECVWVGPPQAALSYMPVVKFNEFVEKFSLGIEEAGCRFVSSADKSDRGNINDDMGLHYGPKDAEIWGEKVVKEMGPIVDAILKNPVSDEITPAAGGAQVR